jgi:hypothetical protein
MGPACAIGGSDGHQFEPVHRGPHGEPTLSLHGWPCLHASAPRFWSNSLTLESFMDAGLAGRKRLTTKEHYHRAQNVTRQSTAQLIVSEPIGSHTNDITGLYLDRVAFRQVHGARKDG